MNSHPSKTSTQPSDGKLNLKSLKVRSKESIQRKKYKTKINLKKPSIWAKKIFANKKLTIDNVIANSLALPEITRNKLRTKNTEPNILLEILRSEGEIGEPIDRNSKESLKLSFIKFLSTSKEWKLFIFVTNLLYINTSYLALGLCISVTQRCLEEYSYLKFTDLIFVTIFIIEFAVKLLTREYTSRKLSLCSDLLVIVSQSLLVVFGTLHFSRALAFLKISNCYSKIMCAWKKGSWEFIIYIIQLTIFVLQLNTIGIILADDSHSQDKSSITFLKSFYKSVCNLFHPRDYQPKNDIEIAMFLAFEIMVAPFLVALFFVFVFRKAHNLNWNQSKEIQMNGIIKKYELNESAISLAEREQTSLEEEHSFLNQLPKAIHEKISFEIMKKFGQLSEIFSRPFLVSLHKNLEHKIMSPGDLLECEDNKIIFVLSGGLSLYFKADKETVMHNFTKSSVNGNEMFNEIFGKGCFQLESSQGKSYLLLISREKLLDIIKEFPEDYKTFCSQGFKIFGDNRCHICKSHHIYEGCIKNHLARIMSWPKNRNFKDNHLPRKKYQAFFLGYKRKLSKSPHALLCARKFYISSREQLDFIFENSMKKFNTNEITQDVNQEKSSPRTIEANRNKITSIISLEIPYSK